tara:strand:- start:622 stop:819 length:198 start_codon:yes stop_codon:yes gene_type:complete
MYNEEWIEYYQYLELLRQSGITNMFGAAPHLGTAFGLNPREARKVLGSWMENYDLLISNKIIKVE